MGMISWIDCNGKNNITDNGKECFLLLPADQDKRKKFANFLGFQSNLIGFCDQGIRGYYDGYGRIGSVDVYDAVVFYNILESTDEEFERVKKVNERGKFVKTETIELVRKLYKEGADSFYTLTKELNKRLDHEEEIRSLGISIACYDEDNARLPYPIKITYDKHLKYEGCQFSMGDPEQGFFYYDKETIQYDDNYDECPDDIDREEWERIYSWKGEKALDDLESERQELIRKIREEM